MRLLRPILLTLSLSLAMPAFATAEAGAENTSRACVPIGEVLLPARNTLTTTPQLIRDVAKRRVILLGEHHDNQEHHRWQLQMIAGLHAAQPDLVLGFEMFPRRVQPILNRWVAGELSEAEFLKQVQWDEYWSFDAKLYLPLFHYARMNRIPMYALNIERSLIRQVGEKGWSNIPEAEREGISNPVPASNDYREILAGSFIQHGPGGHSMENFEERIRAAMSNPAFKRFVESQQVWDRAMAQAIAEGLKKDKRPMVVAVMGSGHMMKGFGVPDQLQGLGVDKPAILIPWDPEFDCGMIDKGFADAVIGLAEDRPGTARDRRDEKPKLGVYLEPDTNGVRISRVVENSVAEQCGLLKDDVVVEVAGVKATEIKQIINTVQAMPAGTWLPLKVIRGGMPIEVVAKFPPPAAVQN